MKRTTFQKIIDAHRVRVLPDGSTVLTLDWVWGHEITTPNAIIDATNRGCDVVFNPNMIKTMMDHVNPSKDTASAIQAKLVREWSKKHGIEFLDVGRNGICHSIIPEKGWIRPGQIGIMGDSHTCTHGAFCAISAGVGTTELENGIITGLWICPPQKVIRVNFVGQLPANVYSKDLVLTLINMIGVKGATNAVLEFGGSVIEEMSMSSRMTITNMTVEAGATSGMMMADDKTIAYLESLFPNESVDWKQWNTDSGADYDQVLEIDVSNMVPVSTNNYSPGDVINVSEMVGKKVNQVYIGSCTNGRLEDLCVAESVFRLTEGKVADGVRCIVVPATQHIYEMALEMGIIQTFIKAGCFVSGPTCGACLGMSNGVIAPDEVCVSTTNRNFPGRMGKGGMVHLVSPATAALTAISGVISEPSNDLCERIARDVKTMSSCDQTSRNDWKDIPWQRPNYSELLHLFGAGEVKDFSGRVFYMSGENGVNVDTDQIIPARYLTEIEKTEFGKHCLEDAKISVGDRPKIFESQILVAGENFGCGSSREHAPWALEAAGIRCVISSSFARIFFNSMFAASGLLAVVLPQEVVEILFIERPESISVDWEKGTVEWNQRVEKFEISEHQRNLIQNVGSVGVMIKLAAELQAEGKI